MPRQFTNRWFNRNIGLWRERTAELVGKPAWFLEIGVYEGRCACWMLDHVLTHPESGYVGVDTWDGLHDVEGDLFAAGERARRNLAPFGERARLIQGTSVGLLNILGDRRFDLAYIDGAHTHAAVKADSPRCWALLKEGAQLAWDDWNVAEVKRAINEFRETVPHEVTADTRRQLWVRKQEA